MKDLEKKQSKIFDINNNPVPQRKHVDISINPLLVLPNAAKLTEPINEPTPIIPDIIPSSTGPFSYTKSIYAGKSIRKGNENATKAPPISSNNRTKLFELAYLTPSRRSGQKRLVGRDSS